MAAAKPLAIATFNINGVNRRLPSVLTYLVRDAPDVVCLQELKATSAQFPAAAIAEAGYSAIWAVEPLWNGVAILARGGAASQRFAIWTRASL